MSNRVFNFSPGPATLPLPVLQRVQEEMGNYEGLGASIFEISHFSPEFKAIMYETEALLRELMEIPPNYRITFAHGGGVMQFAMVPLNLAARLPARRLAYVDTGHFPRRAMKEAQPHGRIDIVASSEDTGYDRIPEFDPSALDPECSYLHITSNNTIEGTQWRDFPDTGAVPLVVDTTSDLLSRRMDVSRFGILYGGVQKNLGPAGLAVAIVRDDLLGHALPSTPKMLNYAQLARDHSLSNTTNTFTLYVVNRMLHWMKEAGGVAAMEALTERKAAAVHQALETHGGFYTLRAQAGHRSLVNVVFHLPDSGQEARFLAEAQAQGLYALKGHREMGGIRASLYNGLPLEGAQALASFIDDFARRAG